MKKLLFAIPIACIALACGGGSPEATVQQFFDAVKSGDGETAAGLISSSSLDDLTGSFEEIMNDPSGEELAMLNMLLGTSLTAEELADLDTRGLAALILGSEMIRDEFPSSYEVTNTVIDGDRAVVTVIGTTADGDTDEEDLQLVREDGAWKFDLSSM